MLVSVGPRAQRQSDDADRSRPAALLPASPLQTLPGIQISGTGGFGSWTGSVEVVEIVEVVGEIAGDTGTVWDTSGVTVVDTGTDGGTAVGTVPQSVAAGAVGDTGTAVESVGAAVDMRRSSLRQSGKL